MRFRGRRRKPKVQWLFGPGTQLHNSGQGSPLLVGENPSCIQFVFGTQLDVPTTVTAPLVLDQPVQETLGALTSIPTWQQFALNQVNQYGYRLRRIVGDITISCLDADGQATQSAGAWVAAGIMVRRVADDGLVSAPTAAQDVGAIQNVADPYIWRRSWTLFPLNGAATGNNAILKTLPASNLDLGTKWATAIDQKTIRKIQPEERLFLHVTSWPLPLNNTELAMTAPTTAPTILVHLDYRVLATVFTTGGNRNNTSR